MAWFSEESYWKHKMCILIFSTTFVWNISHSKKNSARCYHKCTYDFMWSTDISGWVLKYLNFSGRIFEKYSNNKFNLKNPSKVSDLFHANGQTDRKTNMTKQIVTSRNFTKAPKIMLSSGIDSPKTSISLQPYIFPNWGIWHFYSAFDEDKNHQDYDAMSIGN